MCMLQVFVTLGCRSAIVYLPVCHSVVQKNITHMMLKKLVWLGCITEGFLRGRHQANGESNL